MAKLRVEVRSPSHKLEQNLRIDVRDDQFALVDSILGQGQLDVQPGLYEVSAVLEDGQQHRRLVHVAEDKNNSVVLSAPDSPAARRDSADDLNKFNLSRNLIGDTGLLVPDALPTLIAASGAKVAQEADLTWRFEPEEAKPDRLPRADFRTPSRQYSFFLPVNPLGYFPVNSCTVHFEERRGRWLPSVHVAKERTMENALQNMLEFGQIIRAVDVAREATTLLRDKYEDPVGAALGALVLNKVGLLQERVDWLKNLARDFPWLPDGAILLASQLSRDPATEDEGLDWLFGAADKPVLFTENFSTLVNLLRRWPSEKRHPERQKALEGLSDVLADIDWSMPTVSIVSEPARTTDGAGATIARDSGRTGEASE